MYFSSFLFHEFGVRVSVGAYRFGYQGGGSDRRKTPLGAIIGAHPNRLVDRIERIGTFDSLCFQSRFSVLSCAEQTVANLRGELRISFHGCGVSEDTRM